MKRKILITISIILIIVTLKLSYNLLINNIIISKYNEGEYNDNLAKTLTVVNFPQTYIANYNYGNILYQKGKYDEAIEKYKKSLKGFIPKKKECNIRINYSLAVCKTVNVDEKDKDSIQKAIEKYKSAIGILTEKGCANENDNMGHNKKAEKLKEDIQKEINRLEQIKDTNNKGDGEGKEEKNENTNGQETTEEKIKALKEEAIKSQREIEEKRKNYDNYSYQKIERNW